MREGAASNNKREIPELIFFSLLNSSSQKQHAYESVKDKRENLSVDSHVAF